LNGWKHSFNDGNYGSTEFGEINESILFEDDKTVRRIAFQKGKIEKIGGTYKNSSLYQYFDSNGLTTSYGKYKDGTELSYQFNGKGNIASGDYDVEGIDEFTYKDKYHFKRKTYHKNTGHIRVDRLVEYGTLKHHRKYFSNGVLNIDYSINYLGEYSGISNIFNTDGVLCGQMEHENNLRKSQTWFRTPSCNTSFNRPEYFNEYFENFPVIEESLSRRLGFIDNNQDIINDYSQFLKNIHENIKFTVSYEWLKYNECPLSYKDYMTEESFKREPHIKKQVLNYYGIGIGGKYNVELVYENLILFSDIKENKIRLSRIKISQKDKQDSISEPEWSSSQQTGIYKSGTNVISGNLSLEEIHMIVEQKVPTYVGERDNKNWVSVTGYDDDFSRPWEKDKFYD
jgi:hypothetical protein